MDGGRMGTGAGGVPRSDNPGEPLRLGWKQWTVIALWALFLLWTGYGAVTNATLALFPPRPINPYAISLNLAAPMVALNGWAFASALLFGVAVVNPFAWLNGKRLVFSCMAFAMMLGRLVSGFAVGLLAYTATIDANLAFAATPMLLLFAGAMTIIAIGVIVGMVFGFFVGIPMLLANQIFAFERSLQIYQFKANSLAGRIARLVLWLRNEQPPEPGPGDSKGARFATPREIQALHKPDDPAAMAFGHIGAPFFIKTDKHVLIMASTRSGKGVTLIIPHLLRYRGSAFVLDPKGENAKATIRRRRTLNSKVHVLDPFGITGLPRARFNPLSRFTPENMEAESKALAAALFIVRGGGSRDHWNAAGQQLLAAVILYVFVSPDIPPERKDLPMVRRLLLGGLKETLDAMVQIDDADGLLRDLALSFLATPATEFGSITSTAQRQTEILDNPYMIACLSAAGPGEEVDFKAWKAGTMTVYLCLAAPKFPTFNRWLRLVLTSALDEMTDTLTPPALPVCFMLDELATLGHLETVENAVGLAAGYGIQLVTVFQDVPQMKDLYKTRWASFIGNAGVRVLFNLDDLDTAEYWSKFVGDHLVENRSQQQDVYGFSKGENVNENMRRLISIDRMMMDFTSDKMLVLAQGARPIKTDRVAYFDDQTLRELWDDPRRPTAGTPAPTGGPPSDPSPTPASDGSPGWGNPEPTPAASPTAPTDGLFAPVARFFETPSTPASDSSPGWGDPKPTPTASPTDPADNVGWGHPEPTPTATTPAPFRPRLGGYRERFPLNSEPKKPGKR